jgi:hypothetical protein
MYQQADAYPTQKRKRASRACDFCHARGLRCRRNVYGNQERQMGLSCLTCIDYGVPCKVDRPIRKRGRKPLFRQSGEPNTNYHDDEPMRNDQDDVEETSEQTHDYRSLHFILRLVRIYRDTMYQC